jgi:hypothetical protein
MLLATTTQQAGYKTNLLPFTGGLEIINRLRPITLAGHPAVNSWQ